MCSSIYGFAFNPVPIALALILIVFLLNRKVDRLEQIEFIIVKSGGTRWKTHNIERLCCVDLSAYDIFLSLLSLQT